MFSRLLLLLLLIPVSTSYGQKEVHWEAEYVRVLNLEYSPSPAEQPEVLYLNAYHHFLLAILNGSDDDYEEFFTVTESWSRASWDKSVFNDYVDAEFEIMSGFLKLKFGHELSAAWSMRSAYRIARDNYKSDQNNALFKKSWGLMQILVGAIPDNYQWVPELFGIRGTIPTGIVLLESIPSSSLCYLEAQALIQLTRSYLLSESEMAAKEFTRVISIQPSSPLLGFLYLNLQLRAHDSNGVIDTFESFENPLPLSSYVYGTALLQAGEYETSRDAFSSFAMNYKGEDFRKDAAYKTFLCYYLEGNEEKAIEAFNQIEKTGSSNTEADRYAKKASSRSWPQVDLMKVRLATDGGFYARAENLLQTIQPTQFSDRESKTELAYRQARLAHFTGDLDAAIANYLETIERQGKERWYFAPNACLQLGYIFLEQGKMEDSESFFLKVKEYRGYEYQKGIERKAHSALSTHFSGS